jgi:hypothetical protein
MACQLSKMAKEGTILLNAGKPIVTTLNGIKKVEIKRINCQGTWFRVGTYVVA